MSDALVRIFMIAPFLGPLCSEGIEGSFRV
jgi:hypothetical protein